MAPHRKSGKRDAGNTEAEAIGAYSLGVTWQGCGLVVARRGKGLLERAAALRVVGKLSPAAPKLLWWHLLVPPWIAERVLRSNPQPARFERPLPPPPEILSQLQGKTAKLLPCRRVPRQRTSTWPPLTFFSSTSLPPSTPLHASLSLSPPLPLSRPLPRYLPNLAYSPLHHGYLSPKPESELPPVPLEPSAATATSATTPATTLRLLPQDLHLHLPTRSLNIRHCSYSLELSTKEVQP
ncbi:hypothetical protein BT69DRAFT_1334306 [Atractiella rhizophila]|nr:hypothetical protein BT69DRAFT_1334306 [Atractiella rhizophila]